MVDSLHDRLADALQTVLLRGDLDRNDAKETREALAAYEAAKKEPAKRVKLPPCDFGFTTHEFRQGWRECHSRYVAALKAQGIEVGS